MKTDLQIQKDVLDEIQWEPFLKASEIGVSVKDGVVTLSGQVDSYSKKTGAEKAAKRVTGVKAVAEDIQVGISPVYNKTDAEIAAAILNALKWHTAVSEEKIKIKVENGVVTLDGEVDYEFQRVNARKAIEYLTGVRSVINLISLKPKPTSADIRQKITAAFYRNATIDSEKISVEVNGNVATLKGNVRSLAEQEDAENAAWAAPGITLVKSDLKVVEPEYSF